MTSEIRQLIEESIKQINDANQNKKIILLLKQVGNDVVLEILKEMVDRGSPNAFYIAKGILNNRRLAMPFFEYGLSRADASTVKDWMEFAIPVVGLKRVVNALKSKENESPGIVDKALYWLPGLVKHEDLHIVQELKRNWH